MSFDRHQPILVKSAQRETPSKTARERILFKNTKDEVVADLWLHEDRTFSVDGVVYEVGGSSIARVTDTGDGSATLSAGVSAAALAKAEFYSSADSPVRTFLFQDGVFRPAGARSNHRSFVAAMDR